MDSPLVAATTEKGPGDDGAAPQNGTIAALLAQKNVHDRLYSGPSQQKLRVKDARQKEEAKAEKRLGAATEACLRLHREGVEQKKEVLQKAQEKKDEEFREDHPFRPTFPNEKPLFKPEKITGTRQEAWQRLQQSNSQKALALEKSREKQEAEFTEGHPFKPTLAEASKLKLAPKVPPRTTQEEWIQMQKIGNAKKWKKGLRSYERNWKKPTICKNMQFIVMHRRWMRLLRANASINNMHDSRSASTSGAWSILLMLMRT